MKTFFKNITVNFTKESNLWIAENIRNLATHHDQNSSISSIVCRLHHYNDSVVANDLRVLLQKKGLTGTNFELLTYKTFVAPDLDGGYPHIDLYNGNVVNARLNLLLKGKNDKMQWWDHNINSNIILQKDVKTHSGRLLRGYLLEEITKLPRKDLYEHLGTPISGCDTLYSPNSAAIVRTDILHATTWTGGPRLILSMQIQENWDAISAKLNA